MTSFGWREVLVDIDPAPKDGKALRFVLSPSVSPASAVYATGQAGTEGAWLEVCPQGLVLAQEIAERMVGGGGAALIGDYGDRGSKNSLRVSVSLSTVNCDNYRILKQYSETRIN